LHGDAVETAFFQGLLTLYLPAALSLSMQEEDGLILFARMRGTLIFDACAGLFDETGLLRSDSRLLGDLVGLKLDGVDCCEKIEVRSCFGARERNSAKSPSFKASPRAARAPPYGAILK
jgi:hypothetical protein